MLENLRLGKRLDPAHLVVRSDHASHPTVDPKVLACPHIGKRILWFGVICLLGIVELAELAELEVELGRTYLPAPARLILARPGFDILWLFIASWIDTPRLCNHSRASSRFSRHSSTFI